MKVLDNNTNKEARKTQEPDSLRGPASRLGGGRVGQYGAQHAHGVGGHARLAEPVQRTWAGQVSHPAAQAAHFRQQVLHVVSAGFVLKKTFGARESAQHKNSAGTSDSMFLFVSLLNV